MRGGALLMVRVALVGAAVMLVVGGVLAALGRPRAAFGPGEGGCAPLADWSPVTFTAAGAGAEAHGGTGFRSSTGEVVVPLRAVAEVYLPGRGLYWEAERRTVSVLGPRDVLSVHFPPGRESADRAVLSGEVVPVRAVLCGDEVYLSLERVAALLDLEVVRTGSDSLLLAPR